MDGAGLRKFHAFKVHLVGGGLILEVPEMSSDLGTFDEGSFFSRKNGGKMEWIGFCGKIETGKPHDLHGKIGLVFR